VIQVCFRMKEDKIQSLVLNIIKGKNQWCDGGVGGYIGFANAWTAQNIQAYVTVRPHVLITHLHKCSLFNTRLKRNKGTLQTDICNSSETDICNSSENSHISVGTYITWSATWVYIKTPLKKRQLMHSFSTKWELWGLWNLTCMPEFRTQYKLCWNKISQSRQWLAENKECHKKNQL